MCTLASSKFVSVKYRGVAGGGGGGSWGTYDPPGRPSFEQTTYKMIKVAKTP